MEQKENGTDKRAHPRESDRVDVEIRPIAWPMPQGPPDRGTLKDVGEGGIGFASGRPYDPGAVLELKIHLAGWQRFKRSYARLIDDAAAFAPLTAVAEVVWCGRAGEGYEVGVKFKDVYEDDYQAMKKYLEKIR